MHALIGEHAASHALTGPGRARRLVVFGYGNPGRGDDALGPALLERAAGAPRACAVETVEDFQLQIEHALDLEDCDLALFLDASVNAPAPYRFRRLVPAADASYTSHAMSPAAVLHVFEQIRGRPAPPAFVLAVRGYAFDLGASLSAGARENLDRAADLTAALLAEPRQDAWSAHLD